MDEGHQKQVEELNQELMEAKASIPFTYAKIHTISSLQVHDSTKS